jgi:type I restriction enzyme M protein
LKGLEITIRSLSEVKCEHLFFRFDSEHCQKAYLANLARIKKWPKGFVKLGDQLEDMTGGATPLGAEYPESGVRFLRVQNIMPGYIDDSDMAYITPADDAELSRSRLRTDDVLLTITGVSYGKSAVVTPEFAGSNINQHSVRMHLRDGTFRPMFVCMFLNAAPGKLQSDQNITGITRPALDYTTIRNFLLPCVSAEFQAAVENCVRSAHESFATNKAAMLKAEEIMFAALGLGDWQPPEPLTYTRPASEAFAANRVDAEYFHPAKRAYLDKLRAMPGQPLAAHYDTVREMFDPISASSIELVRNFDLTDALQPVLDDTREPMPAREIGSTKKIFAAGDVVISRLRAYLREIALVRTSPDVRAVGSSEFIVLRPRNLSGERARLARTGRRPADQTERAGNAHRGSEPSPREAIGETPMAATGTVALPNSNEPPQLSRAALLVFLRSLPVQTILKWSQDGSHHPRFGDEDLISIPVPDAVCAVSPKIGALFENILTARARARELLERAKRAVEIAIEQDEKAALKFLA